MYKLGVNYTSAFGMSCEEMFSLFKNTGFETMFSGFSGKEATEQIAVNAQKNNIVYESLHAPFKNINSIWQNSEDGDVMLSQLCDTVEACREFGIPIAVVHLSSGENAPCVSDIGHKRFDSLIECAVKNNVTVAFENQRKLANLAFVFELYKDVPNVGFCWDTGHEACFTPGLEYMPIFGDKLVYTHVNDNLSEYNKDLHLIPFDGNIDFGRCAEHIRNSGYKGSLTLEIAPKHSMYSGLSCEKYYRRAYDGVKKLRDMIVK